MHGGGADELGIRDTAQKAPVTLTRKYLRLGIQGQCQSDIAKQFRPL